MRQRKKEASRRSGLALPQERGADKSRLPDVSDLEAAPVGPNLGKPSMSYIPVGNGHRGYVAGTGGQPDLPIYETLEGYYTGKRYSSPGSLYNVKTARKIAKGR